MKKSESRDSHAFHFREKNKVKKRLQKKGLSPVVATVLLISIAVVLAVIIFMWARYFVGEKIEKEGRSIELLCDEVKFVAEAYGGKLYVENSGSIPLYGMQIRKKGTFGTDVAGQVLFPSRSLNAGETFAGASGSGDGNLPGMISNGDDITVVPMLLGEVAGKNSPTFHICDKDYGQEIRVG